MDRFGALLASGFGSSDWCSGANLARWNVPGASGVAKEAAEMHCSIQFRHHI